MIEFSVSGLHEIKRHLKEMPKKLIAEVLNHASRAAAVVFARRARELCISDAVRKTIRVLRMSGRLEVEQFTYVVTAGGKGKGRVAHLLEFGVKPHPIVPDLKWRKKKNAYAVWAAKRDEKNRIVGMVRTERAVLKLPKGYVSGSRKKGPLEHPGIAARAFMRPAFDLAHHEAIATYVKTCRRLMHRLARKGILTGSYWEVVNA